MTRKSYIVKDENGDVVGKYEKHSEPNVPDDLNIERVDDLSNQSVDWDERLLS